MHTNVYDFSCYIASQATYDTFAGHNKLYIKTECYLTTLILRSYVHILTQYHIAVQHSS